MKKTLLIPFCLLLLLTSCEGNTQSTGGEESSFAVYFSNRKPYTDGVAIAGEDHKLPGAEDSVEELIALLLGTPDSDELISPVPSEVSLTAWSLQDGVLNVEFSEGYGGLSGIDLTIADYCITLTLCQLDEVRSVVISVESDLIPSRYYKALRSSDVLLSALEDAPAFVAVALYFPTADELSIEYRDVLTGGGMTRSESVVKALMEGPRGDGLQSLMPEDAVLRSTLVENGVCYVNFSASFGEAPIAAAPEGALLLYSIVDTLCNLSGVDEVQLLIEGKAPISYGGIPTLTSLEPDYSLVKKD